MRNAKKENNGGPIPFAAAASLKEMQIFVRALGHSFSLADEDLIKLAFRTAKAGHSDQFRDSSAPYFVHCVDTAIMLCRDLGITDPTMICASLLHDTLEDSLIVPKKLIKILFGWEVYQLVIAVTKPKRSDKRFGNDDERHRFYFQQLKQAGARVKLLKLVDRLQNIRTLTNCEPAKRARKRKETVKIYRPLIADIRADFPKQARWLDRQFDFWLGQKPIKMV